MDDIKIIICFKCLLKVVIICGSSFLLINVGFKCFFKNFLGVINLWNIGLLLDYII